MPLLPRLDVCLRELGDGNADAPAAALSLYTVCGCDWGRREKSERDEVAAAPDAAVAVVTGSC